MVRMITKKNFWKHLFCKIMLTGITIGLFTGYSQGANIVFDLGGVLTDTSYLAVCRNSGFCKILCYLILKRQNPGHLLFSTLNSIDLPDILTPNDKKACDAHGNPLPVGLIHWLKGTASCLEIIDAVDSCLQNDTIHTSLEKCLVKAMVRVIFDPVFFAKTHKIYSEGLAFVDECIKQGHKVFVLSNLDGDSWLELQKILPGFFERFDGIVISADVKVLKPDPAIYSYLLTTWQLNPDETVFIDDQKENLDAAREFGIHTIHCNNRWFKGPDFSAIKNELATWLDENKKIA